MLESSGQGEWLRRRFPAAVSGVLSATSVGPIPPVAMSFLKTEAAIQLGDMAPESAFALHINRTKSARLNIHRPRSTDTHWMGLHGCAIYDLSNLALMSMDGGFDTIRVYLPTASLEDVVQNSLHRSVSRLLTPQIGVNDDVLSGLASTIENVFKQQDMPPQLFIDHLALCFQVHLLDRYSELIPINSDVRGGLAPWQLKRVLDLMMSRLNENMALAELAASCNLSSRHFSRAFRQSTGLAPFQWLALKRLETARELVLRTRLSVQEIAWRCGFADHSHLSRSFRRKYGMSPAEDRRRNGISSDFFQFGGN